MASNEIPRSYDPLVELMEDAADGAATHSVTIGSRMLTSVFCSKPMVTPWVVGIGNGLKDTSLQQITQPEKKLWPATKSPDHTTPSSNSWKTPPMARRPTA